MGDEYIDYDREDDDYKYDEEEEYSETERMLDRYEYQWSKEEVNYINGKLKSD